MDRCLSHNERPPPSRNTRRMIRLGAHRLSRTVVLGGGATAHRILQQRIGGNTCAHVSRLGGRRRLVRS